MRTIRFRWLGDNLWRIAFSEADLRAKLDGQMAEVIMPAAPLIVRLWRVLFPLRGTEMKVTNG